MGRKTQLLGRSTHPFRRGRRLRAGRVPRPRWGRTRWRDMANSPGAYVTAAGQSDKFEIMEGKLAVKMGSSDKVRAFGHKMITDHTKSTMKVMAAAKKSGLPKMPPPMLRPDQQDMVAQLKGRLRPPPSTASTSSSRCSRTSRL